jgi:quinolinate synthase
VYSSMRQHGCCTHAHAHPLKHAHTHTHTHVKQLSTFSAHLLLSLLTTHTQGYNDAYLTAHFEVPGEMFGLAMEAKARGMGVVGSTSNILDFIAAKVEAALAEPHADRLTFVLGTEAGMITSIVRRVQAMLRGAGRDNIEVEVVFPVNPAAINASQRQQQQQQGSSPSSSVLPAGLAVLPGPAAGEGCSSEGGCASCPYMKMNSLDALMHVVSSLGNGSDGAEALRGYQPRAYSEQLAGVSMAQAGCVPILHMRHFSQHKALSDALVQDIVTRSSAPC